MRQKPNYTLKRHMGDGIKRGLKRLSGPHTLGVQAKASLIRTPILPTSVPTAGDGIRKLGPDKKA